MKKFDKIIINFLFLFILFLWLTRLIDDVIAAAFIASLIWITLRTIVLHLATRYKNTKSTPVSEMETSFALLGQEETVKHFLKLFPDESKATTDCGYIVYTEKDGKIKLLYPAFKFSTVGNEDLAKVYRYASNNSITSVTILGKTTRATLLFAKKLCIDISFFDGRRVQKFLIKHNAVPKSPFVVRKTKPTKEQRISSLKTALNGVFDKKRARFYFISAISLSIASVFTPLKVYYLAIASLCFVLMGICYAREYIVK